MTGPIWKDDPILRDESGDLLDALKASVEGAIVKRQRREVGAKAKAKRKAKVA